MAERTGLPNSGGFRRNIRRFAGGRYAWARSLQRRMWTPPFQFAFWVKPWLRTFLEWTTRRARPSAFRVSLARSLAFFVQKDFRYRAGSGRCRSHALYLGAEADHR